MASRLYSQLPLNTSNWETRTLTVHPSDNYEAPISCSLDVASLNGDCDFEALSYVWHEPSLADVAPVAILVNGYEFTPTPNLFSALQHLRLPQKSRKLWVDAICINQDDLDERNAQVPLMTRIYISAQAVAVWLGPSNSDIDAYATLEPLMAADVRLFRESFSRHFKSSTGPTDPEIVTELEKMWIKKAPNLQKLLPGHYLLISNTYWSRMWTYQECCLPAASRVFYCGNNQFTKEQVGSYLILSHSTSLSVFYADLIIQRERSGGESRLLKGRQNCFVSLVGFGNQPQGASIIMPSQHALGFDTHLRKTKHRICKDPLDRFYAIYGLVQDPSLPMYGIIQSPSLGRFGLIQNPSHLPLVDYSKNIRTVSAEIARYLMLEYKGAQLFDDWDCGASLASVAPSDNAWPSWVPDFRTTTATSHVDYRKGVQPSSGNKVNSISHDLSTVMIQGNSFGLATILAGPNSGTIDELELFANGLGQALTSLAARSGPESVRKGVDRIITALLFHDNRDEAQIAVSLRDTLADFLLNWHSDSPNRHDEVNSSPGDVRPNMRVLRSSGLDRLLWQNTVLGDQTEAKVIFVTDDLHLGFCNAQMRDGDIVARLGSQKGSCVLRRCGAESPGNPLEETVTMIGPSAVRYLPLIWDAETEDSDTWFENMTVDETEPVVFTIR